MLSISNIYSNKVKIAGFAGHFLMVAMIFVLPELLFSFSKQHSGLFVYIRPASYILLFYLNYYIIFDKTVASNKSWSKFAIINLLLCAILSLGLPLLLSHSRPMKGQREMPVPPPAMQAPVPAPSDHSIDISPEQNGRFIDGSHEPPMKRTAFSNPYAKLGFLLRDIIMQILVIALALSMKLAATWKKWEEIKQQAESERREMELKNLRNQLNPHFLFNTLNNIYSLIAISGDKAQKAVHQLSQMLRYILYENEGNFVSLDDELKFIKNYISLMQLRLPPSVKLSVKISESDSSGLEIAPLLFISLVENAFKHGARADQESFISISLMVMDNWIVCDVKNSCFPTSGTDSRSSGIGLANLKKRLSIIYPKQHKLTTETTGNTYHTVLSIKLN
ncbi:MAG: histidine kinase [Bacteroidaceae bacterium]|nr:histidine kinase [Bacteroidaceae bacterium]